MAMSSPSPSPSPVRAPPFSLLEFGSLVSAALDFPEPPLPPATPNYGVQDLPTRQPGGGRVHELLRKLSVPCLFALDAVPAEPIRSGDAVPPFTFVSVCFLRAGAIAVALLGFLCDTILLLRLLVCIHPLLHVLRAARGTHRSAPHGFRVQRKVRLRFDCGSATPKMAPLQRRQSHRLFPIQLKNPSPKYPHPFPSPVHSFFSLPISHLNKDEVEHKDPAHAPPHPAASSTRAPPPCAACAFSAVLLFVLIDFLTFQLMYTPLSHLSHTGAAVAKSFSTVNTHVQVQE
ncbi:hypothetical protein C8R47DRAFT_1224617 [Mycena vitilis]|nr:hypothetical protein C8R47DRAFT_1224617 [Mycena vitilis]